MKYRVGQTLNRLSKFTSFFESESEKRAYDFLEKNIPYSIFSQVWLSGYRVDFLVPELDVIIEVDGIHHNQQKQKEHDRTRDLILQKEGYRILRIPAESVYSEKGLAELLLRLRKFEPKKDQGLIEWLFSWIWE